MMQDPYKTLGLTYGASDEEVTRAYRQLAKKHHPDLNPGNKDAQKKMSEINAAYEQIKSGNVNNTGYGGTYGGNNTASGGHTYNRNGENSRGEYNPYADFNLFDIFGGFGEAWTNANRQNAPFGTVKQYIKAGRYNDALNALASVGDKTAEWYYYSAIANYGAGNKVTALSHAKTAVQIEPNNGEYQRILNQIQSGGNVYAGESSNFGRPRIRFGNIYMWFCLSQLFCTFCGRFC